jgi:hypothetical protein
LDFDVWIFRAVLGPVLFLDLFYEISVHFRILLFEIAEMGAALCHHAEETAT